MRYSLTSSTAQQQHQPNTSNMRFQVQILLVAAVCAAFFHGARSVPMLGDVEPTSLDAERTVDDNGENDENPFPESILIFAAKIFVKQVGCDFAVKHAQSCGARQLSLVPLDRSPEEDDVDQSIVDIAKKWGWPNRVPKTTVVSVDCKAAKFISMFC